MLLTMNLLSSCQSNKLSAAIAVQEQTRIIKDTVVQAEINEKLAAELPKQPEECGKRTQINAEPQESYAKLSTRLFIALKESNDIRIACYKFNEKIREDRMKIYASSP